MDNKTTTLTALENLRKRLLELTARNRLINFTHTKRSGLRVINRSPDHLAEMLLAEKQLRFLPVPEPKREQLITAGYIALDKETGQDIRLKKDPNAEEWARWLGLETSYEIPMSTEETHPAKRPDSAIQTLFFPYELETRLRNLRQTAESAIESTGANILYLAFGFLEWFDSNDSDKLRLAPLYLLPVRLLKGRLNRETGTYEYALIYSGEDILPNLSLREKLRADFALALPDLDETIRPETYFQSVQNLICHNQPRWQLRRYITLAFLNFSKLLMYLDLDPNRWPEGKRITEHPVVTQFLERSGEENQEGETEPRWSEEYPIDELPDIYERFPLIDDADSSQHSALIDAINGKNLVIEGPPGTGKSQTITNLIAAAMAQGKKVLFVAEKLAALEVVRRRLDLAKLGEFCLELHSHKSQKRKVLDEVKERLRKRGHYRKPNEIDADIARYEELKQALKNHAERINRLWKETGKTLHEIFMTATRHREALGINPDIFHPTDYDGENFDPARQRRSRDQVVTFGEVYNAVAAQLDHQASLQHHPWYGVSNSELQIFDSDRVKDALEQWQVSLMELTTLGSELAVTLQCEDDEVPGTLSGLEEWLLDLERLPKLEGDELLDTLPALCGEILNEVTQYLEQFNDIQTRYARLAEQLGAEVLHELSSVDRFLRGGEQLRQLVRAYVELGALGKSIQRLQRLQNQLAEIQEPVSQIQTAVGENAARHLVFSEAGLRELKQFIVTVTALPPSYWKLRDDLFDNDELDRMLPEMRRQLESLHALRSKLASIYNIDRLSDPTDLAVLRAALISGGVFRWLKGNWRAARKRLLASTASPQVKFGKAFSSLNQAMEFASERKRFEENKTYNELLSEHATGLDTDIASLEVVRTWYKEVRRIYGVGFGPKVALGNTIIDLPNDLARAIRVWSEQGIAERLDNLLNKLVVLRTLFTPESAIQSKTTVLIGEGGLLGEFIDSLKEAVRDCEPLMTDQTITLSEFLQRIMALDALRKAIVDWKEVDYDDRFFQSKLGLRIGLDANNEAALAMAQHTLRIAHYLDRKITISPITSRIYASPDKFTFDSLYSFAERLRSAVNVQSDKQTAFETIVALDRDAWTTTCKDNIADLMARNANALSHGQYLANWLDCVRVREQLAAMGLAKLANAIENGDISVVQAESAYYAGAYDLLAREILREKPELARFSGHSQEALQRQFKDYDERLKALQREKIAWLIDQAQVPRGHFGGRVSEYTECSLLEHECGKKTKHLPIRQLLKRAGEALVNLKPCFMMGPMSVAQYLEPGQLEFDMVVMDEASQIKPEDALGAVARGAQLVVVGDPKQLPPTTFFDHLVDDEGDEGESLAIQQANSILDGCLPIFPLRRLRWHYRSQHESLIAFSNHSFYDSDLVLFPSPLKESKDHGVQYSRVRRGCFVNRRNLEEAKVISEAVREHFRHRPEQSLGVVAMSAEQRDQIERAIEVLTKEDVVFQEGLEEDQQRHEPLFIKNLENVQGDERDVIFISMTYGPQEPGGKVHQRFGPINSDVGWRRLNVLFTRSKMRMHIFSSMGSEDIVIGLHSKRGVKALRDFLAYCETGVLHHTEGPTGRSPDSDFEISVADSLRKAGFECVPQVGVAGFFIDLAVVDPGNPGRYLMGLECDGATYHSAKSVRDRDRLRQSILERLGWRIRRIWSTDWFKNPQAELVPIIRELHELKSEQPIEPKPAVESEAEEIEEIIEEVEAQEAMADPFISEEVGLREKLMAFDKAVIRKELLDTPDNQRLLRPAMLEALVEYQPTTKSEFVEYIPAYLRQSTKANEGKFLDSVLEIIESTVESMTDS